MEYNENEIKFQEDFFMKKTIMKISALAILVAMVCVMIVSCAPASKPEDAKAALEDAGYTVILNDGGLIGSALLPEGAEATLVAVKGDDEYISITYYKDKDALNDAWDKIEDDVKEIKEEYEDVVCKKSGNMIYFGTKQAVKDAR